eukprot:m.258910 g.258910  ORF g.258910 m.258910 type:complete len:115 (-) comp22067_c0_seq1:1012-1356(-)
MTHSAHIGVLPVAWTCIPQSTRLSRMLSVKNAFDAFVDMHDTIDRVSVDSVELLLRQLLERRAPPRGPKPLPFTRIIPASPTPFVLLAISLRPPHSRPAAIIVSSLFTPSPSTG